MCMSLPPEFHPGAKSLHCQPCLFLLFASALPQAPWLWPRGRRRRSSTLSPAFPQHHHSGTAASPGVAQILPVPAPGDELLPGGVRPHPQAGDTCSRGSVEPLHMLSSHRDPARLCLFPAARVTRLQAPLTRRQEPSRRLRRDGEACSLLLKV